MKRAAADALIDLHDDDKGALATAFADALDSDADGAWDVAADPEYGPRDRAAIVESSGAYWLVYRGTEPDSVTRFGDERDARAALAGLEIEVTS